ncbi:HNH/ENDO VII family nuclease [Duganella sp. Root198D2]|uniref:HNH/ENDO VII family nuclease n=2 Tax=unclassified Duganella TaxID=2636909 RepID=UPI0019102374
MDAETGLVYFQARYYDPQLGRFITQDPYEGDWNTPLSLHHYLYAYANPTVYVDLNGYQNTRPNCFSQNPDDCMSAEAKQQRTAHRDVYDREERAKGSKRFRDSVGNNFDEVQRDSTIDSDLTKESSEGGIDVETMTPGQIQSRKMNRIGVEFGEIGGAILEAAGPDRYSFAGGMAAKYGARVAKAGGKFVLEGAKDGLRLINKGAKERRIEQQALKAEQRLAAKEAEHAAMPRQAAEGSPRRSPCKSCFVAGTLVSVQGGFKSIEDVREGDLVLSKSDVTGELAYKPVLKLILTQNKGVFDLTLRSATGESETLTVTDNHPFWVLNKGRFIEGSEASGWVESGKLKLGMLVQSNDGTGLDVVSLVDLHRSPETYNLTVDDFHSYFVGHLRAWVHNVDCIETWDAEGGRPAAEVATTRRLKYWEEPRVVGVDRVGYRKVYSRNDLFDPYHSVDGMTNIQRMKKGRPPIGYDGEKVNLHHLTQDEPGALAEVGGKLHSDNTKILHGLTEPGKSFRYSVDGKTTDAEKAFNNFRYWYWTERAKGFK